MESGDSSSEAEEETQTITRGGNSKNHLNNTQHHMNNKNSGVSSATASDFDASLSDRTLGTPFSMSSSIGCSASSSSSCCYSAHGGPPSVCDEIKVEVDGSYGDEDDVEDGDDGHEEDDDDYGSLVFSNGSDEKSSEYYTDVSWSHVMLMSSVVCPSIRRRLTWPSLNDYN